MRLTCPLCGTRDLREFSYLGSAELLHRPAPDAPEAAFFDYVYMRDNPAGDNPELWHHAYGCRAWLVVTRNVTTHDISETRLARDLVMGAK